MAVRIKSFLSGFYGDPEGDPADLDVVLSLSVASSDTDFTFVIDRDGAKRLAALLLSHALSPTTDQDVTLGILSGLHKKLGSMLPESSSWTQEDSDPG